MKISRPGTFILIFWAVMSGWLIRYEAFPQWFTHTFGGYRALFEGRPFILDSWMEISFNNAPIGYSHTWLDSDIESRVASHTIRNKTVVNLNLLGENQTISVFAGATLDETYSMQSFFTTLISKSYRTDINGRRIENGLFEVNMQTPAGVQTTTISIPDDTMIYSPATEMAVRRMKPGDSMRMSVLDPVSMTISEVTVKALRREVLEHDSRDVGTTLMQLSYLGLDMLSWLDDEGRVLRHETPFGWVMTARPAHKILASGPIPSTPGDIITAMAVPASAEIENPRSSRKLIMRLIGMSMDPESLASHRQIVEHENDLLKLTVSAQPEPASTMPLGSPAPESLLEYLKASPAIQSDHPDIINKANAIIGTRTDSFEAAKAISDWIYDNIRMQPTVSLPSALDVLEQMEGDCNEITYLFVGLARAAGIPARIHVGLMYAVMNGRGAFYYHAWPSVYVGEWVEMDPTWDQATVDATHISLVTGELPEQMRIIGLMGRLSMEIISQE